MVAVPAHPAEAPDFGVDLAVRVRALGYSYPTPDGGLRVLDNIDLEVARATTVAVQGTSGSGKTTLLSVLGGLDAPPEGSVHVAGRDLGQLDRDDLARFRREVVGFVFQDFGLLGQLTALENVELALTFGRVPRRQRRARATELLGAVGLGARASHRPRALSGGEKQRVAIARALANEPQVVLADEPTGNLDTNSTALVLDLVMRLPADHGATVIVVTHDAAVAAAADRTVLLANGRIEPA